MKRPGVVCRGAAWGKFDEPTGSFHRLEHHCADVAACFEALLRDPVLRARFAAATGEDDLDATTAARLTLIAFLHDFGKLNAGFQFKVHRPGIRSRGRPQPAGHVAQALLACDQPELCELLGLYDMVDEWGEGVVSLLRAVLAHHGRPAERPTRTGSGPAELWLPFAGYDPRATAKLLRERGRAWFPRAFAPGPRIEGTPALAHLFAGVVALADQLGSDEDVFKFEPASDPLYMERARQVAASTVKAKGFGRFDWSRDVAVADVRTLFDYAEPRPAQRAAASAPLDRRLLILESETGSGKTEAALLRFAALWRAGQVDGLYFAVPTRAAAKQLHDRVRRALDRLIPPAAKVETVLAVPGYLVAGDIEGKRVGRFEVFWEDEPDEAKRCARWSAESARKFLSAPAAVGTVDQVLLAGLRVKWAHFRAAALSRSLLVVDEVHASDDYMTEVLLAVLRGHLALGGHSLLMSATLGAAARTKFVSDSFREAAPPAKEAELAPYPALTLAGGAGPPEVRPILAGQTTKAVSMSTVPILEDPEAIARSAAAAARDGAKVLVIRNTVMSAQAVFGEVLAQGGGDVMLTVARGPALHHSRFAAEDRKRLDDAVESALGKQNRASGGVIVIGTQTLEQSLDIDADLLITDLCPVDVLLQRVGRLHRHARTDRPSGYTEPRCDVLVPSVGLEVGLDGSLRKHGMGTSGGGGGIYENLLCLEATRRLICDYPTWTIPGMNRMLVERATHPRVLGDLAEALGDDWQSHETDVFGNRAAQAGIARNHRLTREEPFDEYLVFPDLDERVRTRLGEDGPRIVLRDPVTGPFGRDVQTFNLPAHLFRPAMPGREDIEAAEAEPLGAGALILSVGNHRLMYDRMGVRRQEP